MRTAALGPGESPDHSVRAGAAQRPSVVHLTTIPATLRFLSGQAAFLRRAGLGVHAISSPEPELFRFGEEEGVPVHAVPMARQITPLRDLASLWRLVRVLRAVRPAVVDAHTPKAGLLGMLAGTLARTPVRVYHLHGLRFLTTSGWKRRLLRLTERASCALADRVLAVSPSVRAIAVAEGLCPADKIDVLLGGTVNGVDATLRFAPPPPSVRAAARARLGIPGDALVVGFVGRLARDKGLIELAHAWRELRADPGLHLLVVGPEDGTDPPPPAILPELRADPRAHLTGKADTPPLYAAMDVVVLPTYREGFPQVALEAAAMALPVVTTAVSGCIDAVRDGVTGTLVAARDADAIVAAVRRYLADPALRAAHGAAARERVLVEFNQPAIWEALAAEYHDLMLAAAHPPGARASPA
jgi:glycosyltransferase involved in cell wall biosynthesis